MVLPEVLAAIPSLHHQRAKWLTQSVVPGLVNQPAADHAIIAETAAYVDHLQRTWVVQPHLPPVATSGYRLTTMSCQKVAAVATRCLHPVRARDDHSSEEQPAKHSTVVPG